MSAFTRTQNNASWTLGTILTGTLRYLALMIVDAFALLLIYALAQDGIWELVITIALVTVAVNIINLREDLYPLRWMSPALALMALLIIFPLVYTVFIAFTNYGDGHLFTKEQAIDLYSQEQFLPEGGTSFDWWVFQDAAENYALWLTAKDGSVFWAIDGSFEPVAADVLQGLPEDEELPAEYLGYTALDRGGRARAVSDLQEIQFGTEDNTIGIVGRNTAGAFEQRFVFDEETDTVLDKQTETIYAANYDIGEFVSEDGKTLITGFRIGVGFTNFERFLTSPAISGPLGQIFVWTIAFALISVVSTFVVGLLMALLLNTDIPIRRVFRTILIVPYAIPAIISVATWKGMLNPQFGVINSILAPIGLEAPPVFSDPGWAKVGILIINLWLGYPYFMLVCSGALAAIPSDMYEAAKVDGANAWQQFRSLTFPMLLVAVGPLLIASFTFNFNNFVIIEAFNKGGPPIFGTPTPAGHTDILISYAFRLAFGTGRGADFGLASAVTIIIFLMVAGVTLFQFRFTSGWEETSENV